MDRVICIALSVVVLVVAVCSLTYCATTAVEPTTIEITEPIVGTTIPTEPPQVAPEPPVELYDVPLGEELQLHIISEAEFYGIDPAIVFAMAFYESTFKTDAVSGGGYTLGLLQVQPKWHKKRMERLGCDDLLDPYQNVTVAVDYLAEQIARYDGNVAKGITAYNKGHYGGKVTYYAKTILAYAEKLNNERSQ